MKIVVTGGTGYIGARLCKYLADKGEEVIPVCFSSVPENKDWTAKMFAILKADLRQEETIAKIAALNSDVIIHLVSLDHHASEKEPGLVNEVNVLPTWRLLDACTKNGLTKFIYFSTIQVYGKLPNAIIDENYPVNTLNTYGLTHLLSEQICDHYNRKTATNVISVRLSNSYGDPIFQENNCWWLAINDLCKNAFINKEIRLLSDGTPQRDFIHGNDVCKAIYCLINTDVKLINNTYHISSGETVTLMELAQIIKKEFQLRYNQSLPIVNPEGIINEKNFNFFLEKYTIDNNKLQTLGYFPDYSLIQGVNELFSYLEK